MTPAEARHIDPELGLMLGEGSRQRVLDRSGIAPKVWGQVPASSLSDPTYYDRPLLKESVWTWDIPAYYFLGGAAGAALALGAAAQIAGDGQLQKFGQRCHWVGIVGSSIGGGFLIHDLGRPERFLHMLRVFRPTSPMSVGVYILSFAAPLAITAGLFSGRSGFLGLVGSAAGLGAGLFGLALAGYTGVLVSGTAIPFHQATRRWMPPLFLASATASAASILDLVFEDERAARITFIFGTAGRLAELAAGHAVEAAAEVVPRVARPLQTGLSGALWKAATVLTAASLVVSVMPFEPRSRRKWAGALGVMGSLALRFAVHYAGSASARDARAAFRQQRA